MCPKGLGNAVFGQDEAQVNIGVGVVHVGGTFQFSESIGFDIVSPSSGILFLI